MKRKDLIVVPVLVIIACYFIAGCVGTNSNYGNNPVPATTAISPAVTLVSPPVTPPVIVQTVTVDLTAKNMTFNTSRISVPAGATVIINFGNLEAKGSSQVTGVPHNFAVYENSDAKSKIFVGEIITGGQNITYKFPAPVKPGTYFFRCDVHPSTMTGQFIVT